MIRFPLAAVVSASLTATLSAQPGKTTTVAEEVKPSAVSSTAPFSGVQAAANLINGSGLSMDRHDADGVASTMWHTVVDPVAAAPTPGLASARAWVRFDFKDPRQIHEILVWNHNQTNFTNRGFRETKVYGSSDGLTWFNLLAKNSVTLPEGGEKATAIQLRGDKPIRSIILAAESNHGGNCYGLSEVQFVEVKQVPEEAAPFPSEITCEAQPYYRHLANGKPGREITVKFSGAKLFGQAVAETAVAGAATETMPLAVARGGLSEIRLLLPEGVAVEQDAQVSIKISRGAKSVSRQLTVPAKRQWTVFLYPHSHVDIGYTQTQEIVEKINVRNMKVGMEVAEAARKIGQRYVWNPEAVWATENFLKAATPEERSKFHRAVKAGDVGLDVNFAHLNTSACSDEELLHFYQGGLRLRRATGAKVDTMVQVDVPGMSWGLPTAAAQCGIRGVLDFPNGFDRRGSIGMHYERPFWWVSPDGKSRVLYVQGPRYDMGWVWKATFIRPEPYPKYEYPAPGWVQDWPPVADRVKTADPTRFFIPLPWVLQQTEAIEKDGLPYDYFTMTWSMSDNSLVDADLPEAVKDWNAKFAYPKLVIASASEIVDAYIRKWGDKIPEKHGDLTEYWTDGLGTDALRVGYNRISKEKLVQAEVLRSMLAPKNGDAAFNEAAYDAWRNILLGSEHTWGYCKPEWPIAKEVEKVKAGYFEKGREQSTRVLDATLGLAANPDGRSVTVFNTLSFPRSGMVALPPGVNALEGVPVQKLATSATVFLANDIPALGAKSWKIATASPAAASPFTVTSNTLENDCVKVTLDSKTGDIHSLVDKKTGHDFVDPKSPYALNSYRYLKGANPANEAIAPGDAVITFGENGPVCASLVVTSQAEGCNRLVREVRLTAGSAAVECLNLVDKISTRHKEGVHFGFAFAVPDGVMRMDIPWGVMDPMKDQLPGSNKNWLAFQRFVDISGGDRGVTWCAPESPVIEIGDITANLLGGVHGTEKWRKEIQPTQTLFSWALNNHWHTNFPLEQGGIIPFRYSILPHGAYDPVLANRFGLEQCRPLLATRTTGELTVKAPVTIDNPRVFLSTAKPSDDGKGAMVVRLRSLSDRPETVNLAFADATAKSLRFCGGDEVAKESAPTSLTLPPYGCVSMRVD